MRCVGCGMDIDIASGERIGFRDECPGCSADLHACVQCRHHDPAAYNGCREPGAERVSDPERANRCDWFAPGPGAASQDETEKAEARSRLDALFRK